MTISRNGFDCQEMYGEPCEPELQAVRLGVAVYECRVCGSLTSAHWPAIDPDDNCDRDSYAHTPP